ncbi:MAG TPA: serine hydrolase domain-containing protein [Jatrophihabitans sp.]|jgi:CubicO group peptidase (beta-lactamase class C family)|uniref:serine hydrolase domain-containing protein n=1 Tax=Jatrophihabitans sp. TaxID=1932789 RepID=UPI002DFF7756|nr:serine hydrolase domain-containing protein [Jatrophihabitans sp.]
MAEPLDAVADWPVDTAAAAIVGPAGIVATHGPLDHAFPLASVTKPLAALAVLVAVEEEAVSLDDPADEELLPGATLRHLLAHASGMAPEKPMRSFPPAVRRVYSNAGIERAAWLVEQAAGMPFADYLREAVLDPLSLDGTSLPGSPARDGVSTVTDLARVAQELLSSTGLLSAPTLADLRTVQFPGLRGVLPGFGGRDPNDWGLGFEVRGTKSPHWTGSTNSPETYGHFGQSGTLIWIDPVARLGLVALTDRDFGDWAKQAWPALADAVLA